MGTSSRAGKELRQEVAKLEAQKTFYIENRVETSDFLPNVKETVGYEKKLRVLIPPSNKERYGGKYSN